MLKRPHLATGLARFVMPWREQPNKGGLLGWSDALVSAAAALPIFLGMWAGTFMRQFVSPGLFRKLILGVVVLSGLHLSLHGNTRTAAHPSSSSLPVCAAGEARICVN